MTDGQCDICKKRDRHLISVVSKTRLRHVCPECFFERFMIRRETGTSFFDDERTYGAEDPRLLEYVRLR
jgi:hypothetical protein